MDRHLPQRRSSAVEPARRVSAVRRYFELRLAVIALVVPTVIVVVVPLYLAAAFAPASGRHVNAAHALLVILRLYVLYVGGYVLFALLRGGTTRAISVRVAGVLFLIGGVVFLFSFGARMVGGLAIGLSYGGMIAALPRLAPAQSLRIVMPTRGAILYAAAALIVPLALCLAIAIRSYYRNDNPASETFGTVWLLFGLYATGYALWSWLRAVSATFALFSAGFLVVFGLPSVAVLAAAFGPFSLVVPFSALGGFVASLPVLWQRDTELEHA